MYSKTIYNSQSEKSKSFFAKISLIIILMISMNLSAKNFSTDFEKIYTNNDITEKVVQTKILTSKKYQLKYEIKVGSDSFGNISRIEIKLISQTGSDSGVTFLEKYKKMITRFESEKSDGKRILIFPQESCMMKCMETYHCTDKPTNAGLALCSGDCFEECYL